MKVGDLVRCPTLPRSHPLRQEYRIGIVSANAAQKNCYVVRFFDGRTPSSNAVHSQYLRIINESR